MRTYCDEPTRARAVGLYTSRLAAYGGSLVDARRYVGDVLGVSEATVRRWITTSAAIAALQDPAAAADRAAKHAALRKERADRQRAIDLLVAASTEFTVAAFYARRSRAPSDSTR